MHIFKHLYDVVVIRLQSLLYCYCLFKFVIEALSSFDLQDLQIKILSSIDLVFISKNLWPQNRITIVHLFCMRHHRPSKFSHLKRTHVYAFSYLLPSAL